MVIKNYVKPNDQVTLIFNQQAKAIRKAWELTENGPKALQPSDSRGPEAELLLSMSEFQFLNEVEQTVSKTNQKR